VRLLCIWLVQRSKSTPAERVQVIVMISKRCAQAAWKKANGGPKATNRSPDLDC
jgi:hypothetical protein